MSAPTTEDVKRLVDSLRQRLVMSMFATQQHLYGEQERQRAEAADALETMAAEREALKEVSEKMATALRMAKVQFTQPIAPRGHLQEAARLTIDALAALDAIEEGKG